LKAFGYRIFKGNPDKNHICEYPLGYRITFHGMLESWKICLFRALLPTLGEDDDWYPGFSGRH
jgi:hypothetical protein